MPRTPRKPRMQSSGNMTTGKNSANREPQPQSPHSVSPYQQRSTVPPLRSPTVEAISPILGHANLATSAAQNQTDAPSRQTFTHIQRPTQFVPPSAVNPIPISFNENPDAIALKAAISILQLQKRKGEADLITLQKLQNRARNDPEGFKDSLAKQIPKKTDGLLNLSGEDSNDDDDNDGDDLDDDDDDENENNAADDDEDVIDGPESSGTQRQNEDRDNDEPMLDFDQPEPSTTKNPSKKAERWPSLPARQNVVRMPVINWSQYAVVGESLDKLHEDQRKNPMEGAPQQLDPDGRVRFVEGGQQRPAVVAAPYDPFKDKIEKKKKR